MQYQLNTDASGALTSLAKIIQQHLKQDLVAVYTYGSVLDSDFDARLSDLDILVVTKQEISEALLPQLEAIHVDFSAKNHEWSNRLDIAYISKMSLQNIKNSYDAAIKWYESPFVITKSQDHWIIDWYKVRNQSVTLYGESPKSVLQVITKEEFQEAVKKYILGWTANMPAKTEQTDLAYVVLTMCRSLYAFQNGQNISKPKGAEWMIQKYPQFEELINKAISLSRSSDEKTNLLMQRETIELVKLVCDEVEKSQ